MTNKQAPKKQARARLEAGEVSLEAFKGVSKSLDDGEPVKAGAWYAYIPLGVKVENG